MHTHRYLSSLSAFAVAAMAWSATTAPGGAGQLNAVSCTGPSFCLAVGSASGGARTLAETWNGSRWAVIPSPSPGSEPIGLLGVSCVSPSFCMAVGRDYDSTAGVYEALAQTWNGTTWRVTPAVSRHAQSVLYGVSCTSSADCVAVGYTEAAGRSRTLVETWNGRTWSAAAGGRGGVLQAVSCPGVARCEAVGWSPGTSGSVTLAESWNGHTWSAARSASPGSGNNELLGVSCTSTTRCLATGFYSVGFGPDRPLAQIWNGRIWSPVTAPDRGSGASSLEAVSCAGLAHCVAAGYSASGHTLIESWWRAAWSLAASPDPGRDNQLLGVSCAATNCRAVGSTGNGSLISTRPLVETGG